MDYESAFVRAALWGSPAAMIVYGAVAFEERFKGRLVNALLVLGAAAYSIYLFHMTVIKMVIPGRPIMSFAMSILVGIAMWRLGGLAVVRPSCVACSSVEVTAFQRVGC